MIVQVGAIIDSGRMDIYLANLKLIEEGGIDLRDKNPDNKKVIHS